MRIGAKKRPFYRVVAVDERLKRTGGYLELLGTYNPLTEPKDIKLKQDRIDYWIKQGAQPSDGYLRMIGKAPQRPPRKPKKEKKTEVEKPQVEEETPATTSEVSESKEKKEEVPVNTSNGGPVPSGTGNSSEVKTKEEAKESEKKDEGSA